jgi:hypothetical protein
MARPAPQRTFCVKPHTIRRNRVCMYVCTGLCLPSRSLPGSRRFAGALVAVPARAPLSSLGLPRPRAPGPRNREFCLCSCIIPFLSRVNPFHHRLRRAHHNATSRRRALFSPLFPPRGKIVGARPPSLRTHCQAGVQPQEVSSQPGAGARCVKRSVRGLPTAPRREEERESSSQEGERPARVLCRLLLPPLLEARAIYPSCDTATTHPRPGKSQAARVRPAPHSRAARARRTFYAADADPPLTLQPSHPKGQTKQPQKKQKRTVGCSPTCTTASTSRRRRWQTQQQQQQPRRHRQRCDQ